MKNRAIIMSAITNQYDAVKRAKEIIHESGYSYGVASVVLIGHKDNLWKISALATNFIEIELIIDDDGLLKKFVTNDAKDVPDGLD